TIAKRAGAVSCRRQQARPKVRIARQGGPAEPGFSRGSFQAVDRHGRQSVSRDPSAKPRRILGIPAESVRRRRQDTEFSKESTRFVLPGSRGGVFSPASLSKLGPGQRSENMPRAFALDRPIYFTVTDLFGSPTCSARRVMVY